MKIKIDGGRLGKKYCGLGMVSGNNSSRLLTDYKYENSESYTEILEYLFGAGGLGISLLKLEMGSDINSTSGTEPCVMRYENETPDVTRGAGYRLAADAKKVNPDIMLDMLFWSEPKWVTDSADVYAARYKWYAETLRAAYEKFGLKFDLVSASRNERDIDGDWIKYLSVRLKKETDCPYDFSEIKIVAADEDNSWRIGDMMIADGELRSAVDVIGSHYTSHSTENVKTLAEQYGKTVWFTEGSPPMGYSEGTARFDGSGLAGLNSTLEIACRIAAMYPCGGMTMYEFQPAAAAYYDGVTFCHKQLITACEPWSGFYRLESGYFMALHFGQFFKKGWRYADGACFCDGEKSSDGHALVNTSHCFVTAADEKSGNYSAVIINPTDKPAVYDIEVGGLEKASRSVEIRETVGPNDDTYFRRTDSIIPRKNGDNYEYSVKVRPFSMVTVSTLDCGFERPAEKRKTEILPLPYRDDFSYSDYPADYLSERGFAPRYTTDQGGAFEVRGVEGKNMLMQVITPETKSMEWGGTPLPTTCFGDDRWYNYELSADITLQKSGTPKEVYGGIGMRYKLACEGMSGYSLLLHGDGSWRFGIGNETKLRGRTEYGTYPVRVKISAENRRVRGFLNGEKIFEYTEETDGAMTGGGRAALYSSYDRNLFGNIEITPLDCAYLTRFDDTDIAFTYSDGWRHELMSSFKNYKRTVSSGCAGEWLTFDFEGSGFGIFGENEQGGVLVVSIDGGTEIEQAVPRTGSREIFCCAEGLSLGVHKVKITVKSGTVNVDGAEVFGSMQTVK